MQAAHKKPMPFGTWMTVTANGKSIRVKKVDTGPFVRGRCVDLSKEAFAMLAPLGQGVIRNVTVSW